MLDDAFLLIMADIVEMQETFAEVGIGKLNEAEVNWAVSRQAWDHASFVELYGRVWNYINNPANHAVG